MKAFCAVALSLSLSLTAMPLLAQRVAIIDQQTRTLAISDLASGKIELQVKLADPPTRLLLTPDKSKYVVLSRGDGKLSWIDEFLPTTKGSVSVVDAKSFALIGRAELGWGETGDAIITADSKRLYVLSPGVPKQGRVASLYAVDLTKPEVTGSVAWLRPVGGYPDPTGGFAVSADEKAGVVFFTGAPRAKQPTMMKFVDLTTMKESNSVNIDARTEKPVAMPGGDTFYLLDPPTMRAGTLYGVSFSKQALVGKWPIGINARIGAIDPEKDLLYVISQTDAKGARGANGQLQVLRGAEQLADVKIGDYPSRARLSPDRRTLYVISETLLTTIPTDTLKPSIVKTGVAYMHDLALSSDGSRAYFFLAREEAYCCGLATWDVAGGKKVKEVTLGSTGARFAQALAAVAASVGSYQSSKAAAKAAGHSSFYYSIYQPQVATAGRGVMHVRPDGKSVYALDPQTGYLTQVDTTSGEIMKNISLKGLAYEIVPLGRSATLLTVGEKGVGIIDAETQTVRDEWILGGGEKIKVTGAGVSPDGNAAILLSNAGARGVAADGRLLPVIEGTKHVVDYLFIP